MSVTRAALTTSRARLTHLFPWITSPFIVGAPMRVMSGPDLALAISKAGGLGFIGPGAKPEDTAKDLMTVKELLKNAPPNTLPQSFPSQDILPVGVGFQLWNGDLDSAVQAVQQHRPCVAWLFALAGARRSWMSGRLVCARLLPGFRSGLRLAPSRRALKPPTVTIARMFW
ncbi:hypothetical protein NW754_005246 [Fusarium falciforme]|nr:hypothetical protein NW754_005246 [Fusarium falciforme]